MIRVIGTSFVLAIIIGVLAHSNTAGEVAFFVVLVLTLAANLGKLRCPKCGKRVKLNAPRCHHCGEDVRPLIARR